MSVPPSLPHHRTSLSPFNSNVAAPQVVPPHQHSTNPMIPYPNSAHRGPVPAGHSPMLSHGPTPFSLAPQAANHSNSTGALLPPQTPPSVSSGFSGPSDTAGQQFVPHAGHHHSSMINDSHAQAPHVPSLPQMSTTHPAFARPPMQDPPPPSSPGPSVVAGTSSPQQLGPGQRGTVACAPAMTPTGSTYPMPARPGAVMARPPPASSPYPPPMAGHAAAHVPPVPASPHSAASAPGSHVHLHTANGAGGVLPTTQQAGPPDTVPHPLTVWQEEDHRYQGQVFATSQRGAVPSPRATCGIIDQGNANPRFIRSTLYSVPCSKALLDKTSLPLALVVQPLASLPPKENSIQVVNFGEDGPVRCNRCKAYINPHVSFVDNGSSFVCNLCSFTNPVPDYYQCPLDQYGRRLDVRERPELCFGSVEFMTTAAYCKGEKLPTPPAYIFVLDVTYQSLCCGLLAVLSRILHLVLDELPSDVSGERSKIRVGIITFNSTIHFYNLHPSLAQPQMTVVPDVDDVFLPFLTGFLVDAEESSPQIEQLLHELPELHGKTGDTSSCLGPAIKAAVEALKAAEVPGRIFVLSAARPSAVMPGGLKDRDDPSLFRTDKEMNLYKAQGLYYPELAAECVKHGACVELFCCAAGFVDVPTLDSLVAPTGGEIHLYPNFNGQVDGERLLRDLSHSVSRPTGFDAVMRVRCSTGLRPTAFWGNFSMLNATDVLLPGIDCDKVVGVHIKHDDSLGGEKTPAYYQAALLYTSVGGQRRLRVHNLAVNCTRQLTDVYEHADVDTLLNLFLKIGVKKLHDTTYKNMKTQLMEQSIASLATYRKECSKSSSGAMLILPEPLKLMPLYVNSLLKSQAICAYSDSRLDEKAWLMHCVSSMPVLASIRYLYPTLLPLHNLPEHVTGFPPSVRCCRSALSHDGAYVIANGFNLVLWLGSRVRVEWLRNVFGVSSLAELRLDKFVKLPILDNLTSTGVRSVVSGLEGQHSRQMKIHVVVQGGKGEGVFRRQLCEDGSGDGNPSYLDLLAYFHKEMR